MGKDESYPEGEGLTSEEKRQLEACLASIPREELCRLLVSLAKEDASLKNLLFSRYAPFDETQRKRLEKELTAIRRGYSWGNREKFADFLFAVEAFLYDRVRPLIGKGLLEPSLDLIDQALEEVENWLPGEDYQYRQDWEEWLWDLETVCFELWQQILERTSGKERRRMFERFQENRKKNRSYSQQCRENFYRNEFQEPWMLQEKLRLLDREIEEGQKSASAEEGKVLERLALMEGLNAPKKEIRQYRERYRFLPSIREQMVQEYENAGAYEKAVWLLREAKESEQTSLGERENCSRKLLELYRKTERQEEYKEELLYQIFQFCQRDLELVHCFKEICGSREWEIRREELLKAPSLYLQHDTLLAEEGMYRRLMDEIKERGSVYLLDQHEKELGERFPEEVRDSYIEYVKRRSCRPDTRKGYKNLAFYLKKIARYPQGKEAALEIASSWMEEYRNRPAMMEELEQAGFGRERKTGRILPFPT